MHTSQINRLRAAYSTLRTIQPEGLDRLKRTIGQLCTADIRQLAESGIPFVDTAANSLLVDRGVLPESARLDHAADVIFRKMSVRATA